MAGIRQYKALFSVEVMHEYYAKGTNQDILIEPTASCLKTLQNYNLLQKKSEESRMDIYYETVGRSRDQLVVIKTIEQPIKLSFLLFLKNKNFLNFSHINSTPAPALLEGKPLFYFSNLDSATGVIKKSSRDNINIILTNGDLGVVSHEDKVQLLSSLFNVPTHGSRYIRIMRPQPKGNPVAVLTIDNLAGKPFQPIDWRGLPAGQYEIQWLFNLNPLQIQHQASVIIDPSLLAKQPFALLELYVDSSFMTDEPTSKFQIQFASRKSEWVYIVLDRKDLVKDLDDQTIKYKVENSYPIDVVFKKLENTSYLTQEQLDALDAQKVYIFKANKPLPSYEVPLKGLTLTLKNGNGMYLPNLSQEALKPEIFIHL